MIKNGRKRGDWRRVFRTFCRNRTALIGTIVLLGAVIPLATLAPSISPFDPYEQKADRALKGPDGTNLLGTDMYGRDVLSRILYGARISLSVGLGSVLIGTVLGTIIGLTAGYFGRRIDDVLVRLIDIFMSFPTLLLGLMFIAVMGPGLTNLIVSIGLALTPRIARIARGATISIREYDFVTACRAIGMSNFRIMTKHILPNIMGDIVVMGTLWCATAIILEANFSFIGLGVQPPTPSWGQMIRSGVDYLGNAPWLWIFPGLSIFISVLSFNMLGDGLRDIADPKLRG
jgi:peptide/nickel transport system permease protein